MDRGQPIRLTWTRSRSEADTYHAVVGPFVFELCLSVQNKWMVHCPKGLTPVTLEDPRPADTGWGRKDLDMAIQWAESFLKFEARKLVQKLSS